jgi:eukaryotic-like serine/threonine-protein kinase
VKGVPITEFCDKNHLAPEARLKLFIDVCHAIQHAHHKRWSERQLHWRTVLQTPTDSTDFLLAPKKRPISRCGRP